MSVLTRIRNNQILDATIYANAKIVPGSIVGSLFNSNLTTTSDVTIGGNLTVLGSSTYMTVASTNTYVNDPLIVLNNAFSGTNQYDLGFVFNRGVLTNQALIWDESEDEFRFIATSETGTTYGNVSTGTFSNVRVGNISVQYYGVFGATVTVASGNVDVNYPAGGISTSGNVRIDGGYLTTENTTFNLVDTNATTVNLARAATLLTVGATTGVASVQNANIWLPNATTVGNGQDTLTLFGLPATVTAFGKSTLLTVGETSGTLVLNNPTVAHSQSTVNLFDANVTTLNFAGAATTLDIGATSGTATINNTTLFLPTATNIAVGGASLVFANTVATTVNAFGTATVLNFGAGTGTTVVRNSLEVDKILFANSGVASTNLSTGAVIVTGGQAITGNLNVGGNLLVNDNVLFNEDQRTIGIGYFDNTTNSTNSPASGAVQILGGASISKDLFIGGNLYVSNIFSTGYTTLSVTDPLLYLTASNTFPYTYDIGVHSQFVGADARTGTGNLYQHTGIVRDASDYTWKFFSNVAAEPNSTVTFDSDSQYDPVKAGNLTLTYDQEAVSTTTGSFKTAGGIGVAGNIFQGGAYLDTSASNYIFASTPTTVDAFKAATSLEVGATSGTLIINNPTVVGSQTTQSLFNTVADTVNFARAANITMGSTAGTTVLQGAANIQAITASTDYDNGALLVQGGVGVRGNINVRGSQRIQIGQELTANTYPEDSISVTTSANSSSRISIQNISTGTLAVSEFTAMNDVGSNTGAQVSVGIVSSQFARSEANIYQSNDTYIAGTGNLLVQTITPTSEVKIVVGGVNTTDHYASFSALNSNVSIVREKISTSHTTGAFTVTGGVGFGSNLNVAKGAVFNNTNSTEKTIIKGTADGALFVVDPTVDGVVINGLGNISAQAGVGLKVGGTGAIIIPSGTNSQRPGTAGNVDVEGMIRLNSSSGQLEYYIGGQWSVAGSSFTLIAADNFDGDGANVAFTLGASATTTGVIVSINGVVQIPITSYSVSGTTLTFTEAPATGDTIDVRRLTTTATVNQLSSGFTLYDAQTNWANIGTGNVAVGTVNRLSISSAGDIVIPSGSPIIYDQTAVNIAANATPYVVASFSQTAYATAKYLVQVKNSTTNFQSMEAMVLTDQGGNAYVTTYAVVTNGIPLGSLSANVQSGTVKLWYTNTHPAGINSNVKVQGTYII